MTGIDRSFVLVFFFRGSSDSALLHHSARKVSPLRLDLTPLPKRRPKSAT
ncbi:hypothetical protein Sinac_3303 [Singulisphaera acidiphila DSM 18658]|uniref:Uncharacterized protein n=1 Tax=Singulisphaera acidiphila (strain ATCC BAA-1392 / DSM 18658 / VKM B-2454 / MOB10) TaxID=886293 RepID=L0DFH8_SINAD|nr:hypothetical protein Sinac_3303 [Singulisphaera acidiphila DSM 18658]